jgi:hypothetical protein
VLESVSRRSFVLVGALVLAMSFATLARADGEAGIVVQEGDQVTTYCVAFSGDGITGQDLLKKVGFSIEAYGGGSGLAVCALNQTGCQDASSFTSCFCQCQGSDCTYWAFFTRQYGKGWVYSALAFNLLKAKDGDVHGWKWGKGSLNNAPAPQDITFNQICGHEPRGGIAPTATLAAATALPPTPAAASTGVSTAPTETATDAAAAPTEKGTAGSVTAAPTVTVTLGQTAPATAEATPQVPTLGAPKETSGSNATSYVVFGAIAVVLLALTGAAVFMRQRNGL